MLGIHLRPLVNTKSSTFSGIQKDLWGKMDFRILGLLSNTRLKLLGNHGLKVRFSMRQLFALTSGSLTDEALP